MRPAYITATRSACCATTPRSWVMSSSARRKRAFRSRSRSRIWPWIVTSSAVVGSSAMSSLGWQASAAAISARWRRPPDSWCGYSSTRRCGSGTRTASSSSMARGARRLAARQPVHLERFGDLAADGVDGVERGHRLLQDQADLAAADRAHRPLVERQQVAAVEPNRAADDPSRRVDQAQDRQRGQRLAAARLADQGQRLAGVEREADARHGGRPSRPSMGKAVVRRSTSRRGIVGSPVAAAVCESGSV